MADKQVSLASTGALSREVEKESSEETTLSEVGPQNVSLLAAFALMHLPTRKIYRFGKDL